MPPDAGANVRVTLQRARGWSASGRAAGVSCTGTAETTCTGGHQRCCGARCWPPRPATEPRRLITATPAHPGRRRPLRGRGHHRRRGAGQPGTAAARACWSAWTTWARTPPTRSRPPRYRRVRAAAGQLAADGLAAGGRAEVSVKPTAVGLRPGRARGEDATGNIARICAAARAAGTTVTRGHGGPHAGWTRRCGSPGAPAGPPGPGRGHPVLAAPLGGGLCRARARRARGSGCARARTTRRRGGLPGAPRRRPQLRPRAAGADGRARLPDDRHARPAAAPDRRGPGRSWAPGPRTATSTRCSTGSARRSSAGWPPPGPGSGCTCRTARTGTATWSGGWPSGRRTWRSSPARSRLALRLGRRLTGYPR